MGCGVVLTSGLQNQKLSHKVADSISGTREKKTSAHCQMLTEFFRFLWMLTSSKIATEISSSLCYQGKYLTTTYTDG